MLHNRKTTRPETFGLLVHSLLLTVGDLRAGDTRQDFAIVSGHRSADVEALGLALGCQAVRHEEVLKLLMMAVQVVSDPETWEVEGKNRPPLNDLFPEAVFMRLNIAASHEPVNAPGSNPPGGSGC